MDVLLAACAKLWGAATTLFSAIFPALAGVGVSLHVDSKKTAEMTSKQIAATFFSGVSLAYFFSNWAAEHYGLDPLSYTFMMIQFSVAAIGMSIVAQLVINLPDQIPKWLDAVRTKWFGG